MDLPQKEEMLSNWSKGATAVVITRKPGERVWIGEGDGKICVEIVEVLGSRVRLKVLAPRTIPVLREELIIDGLVSLEERGKELRDNARDYEGRRSDTREDEQSDNGEEKYTRD